MSKQSYITSVYHRADGKWHQYDIQLVSRYGWDYMLASAQFVAAADLNGADTVTKASHPGGQEVEYIHAVRSTGNNIPACPDLQYEGSNLGVGGYSRNLKCPVKLVWFNQTNMLRIFTFDKEIKNIEAYASCIINRFFPENADRLFNNAKKEKPEITAEDRKKAALVLLILGIIWLLGAVVITLTVDGFLPIGSLWYLMALSFIGFGLYQRRKNDQPPVPKKEEKPVIEKAVAVPVEKPAPQPEKPQLWLILYKDNPVYPFIENDRSVRVYRNKTDAKEYIDRNFVLNITTMAVDEEFLHGYEMQWLRYGIKTVKVYSDRKTCESHSCGGNDTEYIGGMAASLMQRMRQNSKTDATAEQKADWHTWQSALAQQLNKVPLLVPYRYGDSADMDSSTDTQLHMTNGANQMLSVLLKTKEGSADPRPGWLGMSLLTKGTTGMMWKDRQVIYIGNAETISKAVENSNVNDILQSDGRTMHPMFADNTKTGLHAVAAFTNLQDLRALYPNERVAAFSLNELLPLAKEGHGLIIDPGSKGISYLMNHNFLAEISEKMKHPMQFYSLPREYTGKRTVVLSQIGQSKIEAISVIRRVTGCGLKTAKEMVDDLPAVVKSDIPLGEAELIVKLLADVGATAEIREQ